jgi:solute:Na+ symporter, SSS family
MQISLVDWIVIFAYFALNLGIGLFYYRRASGDIGEFFVSGRSVPWWLAGTSMVATTFAADTPLVVTGLIYQQGIAGNWVWWSLALSGMLTVFFFAPMWRRSGVLTDMEFIELRYAGKSGAFLRGFRALYLVFLVNTLSMGWVNLAMAKILYLTLGVNKLTAVFVCLTITLIYSAISGLWAVLWTDMVQFVLKMTMVILLAVFAVHAVGGLHALETKVQAADAIRAVQHANSGRAYSTMDFVPTRGTPFFLQFLVLLSINWWASSYPGAEPGGGGYITQRIFSAKDEKNSLGATLWFNVAHYALRPWPWILTALVAIVLLPNTGDKEGAFIVIMNRYLPASLRGLMLAGFAAAYMSTIGTQMNLGASYLVNDVYKRFLQPNRDDHHYVTASRWATLLVTVTSAVATFYMTSIGGAWKFLMAIGAGAGMVFILRWFWWRINAWTEISAMVAAACSSLFLESRFATSIADGLRRVDPLLPAGPLTPDDPHGFAWILGIATTVTTLTWLAVTMLTKPEPEAKLREFYLKVRPAGPGWGPIAQIEGPPPQGILGASFFHWILGLALVYGTLFGMGDLLFGRLAQGLLLVLLAVVSAVLLFWNLNRTGWTTFR